MISELHTFRILFLIFTTASISVHASNSEGGGESLPAFQGGYNNTTQLQGYPGANNGTNAGSSQVDPRTGLPVPSSLDSYRAQGQYNKELDAVAKADAAQRAAEAKLQANLQKAVTELSKIRQKLSTQETKFAELPVKLAEQHTRKLLAGIATPEGEQIDEKTKKAMEAIGTFLTTTYVQLTSPSDSQDASDPKPTKIAVPKTEEEVALMKAQLSERAPLAKEILESVEYATKVAAANAPEEGAPAQKALTANAATQQAEFKKYLLKTSRELAKKGQIVKTNPDALSEAVLAFQAASSSDILEKIKLPEEAPRTAGHYKKQKADASASGEDSTQNAVAIDTTKLLDGGA